MEDSRKSNPMLFARMFWALLGPMLMAPALMGIFLRDRDSLGLSDAFFLLIVLGMLIGRWMDYRYGSGKSSTGEPSTHGEFMRYILLVAIGAAAAWLIAAWYTGLLMRQ